MSASQNIRVSSPKLTAVQASENNKENEFPAEKVTLTKFSLPESAQKLLKEPSKRRPSSCMFVASLRSTCSDDELCRSVTRHFEVYGELASVKVLRDPMNRPYAFVQYTNDRDCKQAIKMGHNSELDGRKLRCEAAKVNRTLFISSFSETKQSDIHRLVCNFGETELIAPSSQTGRVIDHSSPESSFNWFIKFSYRDDAIRAFASLSDSEEYHVEWAQNIDDVAVKTSQFDKFAIFIGQLPPSVTEADIRCHFSSHGTIKEVSIIQKLFTTFAFVTFAEEAAAASAVARDNHSMFMNKTIHVQYRELTSKANSRILLSPRIPVALAPPPIHLKRFSSAIPRWPTSVRPNQFNIYSGGAKPPPVDQSNSVSYSQEYYLKEAAPERNYPGTVPRFRETPKVSPQMPVSDQNSIYYLIPSARPKN
ncbi:hypothetical protein METBIDRAFT_31453 [Metschnikowia bicuspidata var. bicuspidata NRRL YB-4993]|uniref:RRM domain-containing protein n=1 Tax=Metschnikowia bicuspidata var. bicuspidata NRRL YB-4993 TaxID=869754 RepID=A0A1A0HEM6_9ASCO|nr:hypothetical protein METBIDRAFT_31453 [Metschnikowia bicuspidata var. bicuspidata NRRL YB-4993]OBA22574.1 hypothetical protein METBIDRAFT_31453 [Metschnikowia bicuspidata var. bicuspidata NRRL YB-4993]